jgi:AAA15 family ATPase/GTPase
MINRIKLKNFGPIETLDWDNLGKINLVIGNNGSGKSFLLKALYSAVRTLEDYQRGDNKQKSAADILADKLFWTFQPDRKIGDMVCKQANEPLSLELKLDDRIFKYSFGKDTTKSITLENDVLPRANNSIYLPAKEVLSLFHIILKSRQIDNVFGFDDTYLDLVTALQQLPTRGRNSPEFAQSRKSLENIINGRIEYDEASSRWQFKNKTNQKFSIGVTAEGVKKIAILDTLLGNRYLTDASIIFIDEPESALHPKAISELLDIVAMLAGRGIQFFMASHSYFVIKKLFLIAQKHQLSIPVYSFQDDHPVKSDLKDNLPDNPIIDESLMLYEQQLDMD